jgi:ribonucleoside-diphosphate reductase beta chain
MEFAAEKHRERMEQITDASAEIPNVDELVRLSSD